VFGGQIANAASAQNYFPEWIVCGCFLWDTNIAMHFFVNSSQWRHAFGITAREVPRVGPETDWYRAYQEVESNGEPDPTTGIVVFPALVHLANAAPRSARIRSAPFATSRSKRSVPTRSSGARSA
jgi:hypothetical protein